MGKKRNIATGALIFAAAWTPAAAASAQDTASTGQDNQAQVTQGTGSGNASLGGGGTGTGGGGTGTGGGGTTEPPPPPPPAQYTLSVTLQFNDGLLGPATGSVTSSPTGIDCASGTCRKSFTDGTKVTLTAHPGANTQFDGWSGGGCSGTDPCTVTMTQARSVTASFSRTL